MGLLLSKTTPTLFCKSCEKDKKWENFVGRYGLQSSYCDDCRYTTVKSSNQKNLIP